MQHYFWRDVPRFVRDPLWIQWLERRASSQREPLVWSESADFRTIWEHSEYKVHFVADHPILRPRTAHLRFSVRAGDFAPLGQIHGLFSRSLGSGACRLQRKHSGRDIRVIHRPLRNRLRLCAWKRTGRHSQQALRSPCRTVRLPVCELVGRGASERLSVFCGSGVRAGREVRDRQLSHFSQTWAKWVPIYPLYSQAASSVDFCRSRCSNNLLISSTNFINCSGFFSMAACSHKVFQRSFCSSSTFLPPGVVSQIADAVGLRSCGRTLRHYVANSTCRLVPNEFLDS